MAILTLILGAAMLVAGLGALAMSVDLLPTDMGRLYAESGVAFLCAAAIVVSVAALIHKLDRISRPQRRSAPAEPATAPEESDVEPAAPAPAEDSDAWLDELPEPTAPDVREEEINYNRRGRLPSLQAVEQAIATPEPQPRVIGRYSAGGASYDVLSDGSIETETEEGGLRFPSMTEFRDYLARRRR